MNKLNIIDRNIVDSTFEVLNQHSFYHYFPLLFAISESTNPINFQRQTFGGANLFVAPEDDKPISAMYYHPIHPIPSQIKEVMVSLNRCTMKGWTDKIYDTNFIYDLETTVQIKNFRDNAETYKKKNPKSAYAIATSEDAFEVIKRWYSISKRKEFYDFGYTQWLCEHFKDFPDLHARTVIDASGKAVAFSLWGELYRPEHLAIHLISKDFGHPFLQDYIRFETYKKMLLKGFKTVNDGGCCGGNEKGNDNIGIFLYKLKLRPIMIYPIYSWSKT